MDHANRVFLSRLCPTSGEPKLKLMMEYGHRYTAPEVPDPYDGGPEDFEMVLNMLEDATEGLLETILRKQAINR